MTKDWTGNKVTYITTNGFANNRDYDRETNDYYATEPKAVEMLYTRLLYVNYGKDDRS